MNQEPLSSQILNHANPQEQKQMLGEKLYPIIQAAQPELAGKITGMLLEMENSEILHMLEDNTSLNDKVSVTKPSVLTNLNSWIVRCVRDQDPFA